MTHTGMSRHGGKSSHFWDTPIFSEADAAMRAVRVPRILHVSRMSPWSWLGYRYPLVNIQKAMERSTIFNGKTHYFYGHFQ